MTPNEYQTQAERTDAERTQQVMEKLHRTKPSGVRLLHAMLGLSSEAGEFSDSLKKWLFYNQVLDLVNLKEELGDILWYVAQACSALEIDLEDVMQANIAKLQKRFPEKYDDRLAAEQNRDREGERAVVTGPIKRGSPIEEHPFIRHGYNPEVAGQTEKETCSNCGLSVSGSIIEMCAECSARSRSKFVGGH